MGCEEINFDEEGNCRNCVMPPLKQTAYKYKCPNRIHEFEDRGGVTTCKHCFPTPSKETQPDPHVYIDPTYTRSIYESKETAQTGTVTNLPDDPSNGTFPATDKLQSPELTEQIFEIMREVHNWHMSTAKATAAIAELLREVRVEEVECLAMQEQMHDDTGYQTATGMCVPRKLILDRLNELKGTK